MYFIYYNGFLSLSLVTAEQRKRILSPVTFSVYFHSSRFDYCVRSLQPVFMTPSLSRAFALCVLICLPMGAG